MKSMFDEGSSSFFMRLSFSLSIAVNGAPEPSWFGK